MRIARDQHLTPLSILDGTPMPGVYIHAQALAQRIDGNRDIRRLPLPLIWLIAFLVSFACVALALLPVLWWMPETRPMRRDKES